MEKLSIFSRVIQRATAQSPSIKFCSYHSRVALLYNSPGVEIQIPVAICCSVTVSSCRFSLNRAVISSWAVFFSLSDNTKEEFKTEDTFPGHQILQFSQKKITFNVTLSHSYPHPLSCLLVVEQDKQC